MPTSRHMRGQAAIEFAVGLFVFALILAALVGFAPLFLRNKQLQSDARCDAGIAALGSADGSENLGAASAIAARARPPEELADAWDYPVSHMPDETRFADWRSGSVPAGRLTHGMRKKDFRFRMYVGGQTLVDDVGWLAEEVHMPAMDGLGRTGGAQ